MVSTLSAISSLLGRLYFMPTCPMAIPSQTPMDGTSIGVPPAMRTPAFTASATLVQVHMTWNDFAFGGNDTDQWAFQFFFRISHCIEQTPHRSAFYALGYFITSHFHFPFRSGDFPETLYFVLIRKKRRRKRRRHFPSFKFIEPRAILISP